MEIIFYPLRYVYAGIIDGQLKHGESPWMAKLTAFLGASLVTIFIVTGIQIGLFWVFGSNIVQHWHSVAEHGNISYLVVAAIETAIVSLPLVHFICVKDGRYLPVYEKIQKSKDSQLKRTVKAVCVGWGALMFAFASMVLFLSR